MHVCCGSAPAESFCHFFILFFFLSFWCSFLPFPRHLHPVILNFTIALTIFPMSDSYLTLSAPGESQFVEKRSRFISFAFPITSEDEAKDIVAGIRKKYYDARHVCYAYALGYDVWTDEYDPVARGTAIMRANDDGEPGGSAGKPILGQLRGRSLTNVLVVVVRYFGGVKLGTGGLAVAYKTGASDALDAAVIEERLIMARFRVDVPYTEADTAMRFIRDGGADITDREYTATSTILTVEMRQSLEEGVRERLAKIYTLKFVD